MRVGWIWGLYETQLPFPVHCTKERYHIYTDGNELGNAQLLWNTKCAQKNHFKDRIYTAFYHPLKKMWCLFFNVLYFYLIGRSSLKLRWSWSMLLVVFTGHSITMYFKSDSRDPTRTIMSKTRLFWRSVHWTVDWLHPAYLQPSNCTLMTVGINMHVTRIVGVYCLKPFF